MRNDVFAAFGANLGDGEKTFKNVQKRLESEFGTVQSAALRKTKAVTLGNSEPEYWNSAFRLQISDDWSPQTFLQRLLTLESEFGRVRNSNNSERPDFWASRNVDLDLLLWNDTILDEAPTLVVPHPMMCFRRFVLEPLAELAPEKMHPVVGLTFSQLLRRLESPPNFFVEDSMEPISPEILEFLHENHLPILSRRWVCRCGESDETFERIVELVSE